MRDKVAKIVRQVVMETLAKEQRDQTTGLSELGQDEQPDFLRRPMIAANWKMNMLSEQARDYARVLGEEVGSNAEVVICPPSILLHVLREALSSAPKVRLGGQNLHPEPKGAYTGEHSPKMLVDAGATYVILGHSERRTLFGEGDELVALKVTAALGEGLRPILCVGEKLEERESGATFRVLRNQLSVALAGVGYPRPDPDGLVIAYEPVWAIGTGRNATTAQAQEAMAFIRDRLAELFSWEWARRVRLLYGGSASPDNASCLAALPDVDGFLVGGAGLDPKKMNAMIESVEQAESGSLSS